MSASNHPCSPWHREPDKFIWVGPALTVTLETADPRTGSAPEYHPELPTELPGASPFVLWEWVRYKVTVTPPSPGLRIQCGDVPAEFLGQGIYLFQYQNSLGASVIRFPGSSVPDLVLSRKLASSDGVAGYAALYRRMVADVAEALVTLPFHLTGATVHGTARSAAPAGPLFAFHYFRRRAGELVAALERIGRAPHRVLSREEALRPVALARRANTVFLRWSVAHPKEWEEGGGAASRPEDQDIYKMHTYRDALGLRAAAALYPGDQAVLFDRRTGCRRSDVGMAEVVLRDLQGVGAIPLRPEEGER